MTVVFERTMDPHSLRILREHNGFKQGVGHLFKHPNKRPSLELDNHCRLDFEEAKQCILRLEEFIREKA